MKPFDYSQQPSVDAGFRVVEVFDRQERSKGPAHYFFGRACPEPFVSGADGLANGGRYVMVDHANGLPRPFVAHHGAGGGSFFVDFVGHH